MEVYYRWHDRSKDSDYEIKAGFANKAMWRALKIETPPGRILMATSCLNFKPHAQ